MLKLPLHLRSLLFQIGLGYVGDFSLILADVHAILCKNGLTNLEMVMCILCILMKSMANKIENLLLLAAGLNMPDKTSLFPEVPYPFNQKSIT